MTINLLDRYKRWRHSYGFGIHSPWAYSIIRDVLRAGNRYGYYDYHAIDRNFKRDERKLARMVYALIVHLHPESVSVCGDVMWQALAQTALEKSGTNGKMLVVCDPERFTSAEGFEYVVFACLDTTKGRALWQQEVERGGMAIDTARRLGILGRRPDLPNQCLCLRSARPLV